MPQTRVMRCATDGSPSIAIAFCGSGTMTSCATWMGCWRPSRWRWKGGPFIRIAEVSGVRACASNLSPLAGRGRRARSSGEPGEGELSATPSLLNAPLTRPPSRRNAARGRPLPQAGRGGARGAVVPLACSYSCGATTVSGKTNVRNPHARPGTAAKAQLQGEVQFDDFTRGRYATDASSYQMMPLGVVVPRSPGRPRGAGGRPRGRRSVPPRGGGTSQCGQTVNPRSSSTARNISNTRLARCRRQTLRGPARHRARRVEPPAQAARAVVSGRCVHGVARHHRRHGRQQFLRHALAPLRHHARQRLSIDAVLADGKPAHFGPVSPRPVGAARRFAAGAARARSVALGAREADEIKERFPKVQRRVGGYNIDEFVPGERGSISRIS